MTLQGSLRFWLRPLLFFLLLVADNPSHAFVSHQRGRPQFSPTRRVSTTQRNGMWSGDTELQGSDRFKACVPYILPILDMDHYSKYFYERIPILGDVHEILVGPLVNLYEIFPYMGIVLFVALTIGTRSNTDMDRNVRFSAQQAALIDVALIPSELVSGSLDGVDMPRALMEPCSNFVFYTFSAMIIYCVYSNIQGKKPDQIPYISQWSEFMLGPGGF